MKFLTVHKRNLTFNLWYLSTQTVVIVGGLATQKQERLLRGRPDIVIATPGRLWELVQEGDEHLSTLNEIKYDNWLFTLIYVL